MRYLVPLVLSTLLWWVLTEAAQAWVVGVPVILLSSWVAVRLQATQPGDSSRHPLRWLGMPRFAVFFLWQSLKAGLDVAQRTLKPVPDINPGTLYYHTSIPHGTARYFFGTIVGLFPGTLCTEFSEHDNQLVLHVLDTEVDIVLDCRRLEREIERLFGLTPTLPTPQQRAETNNMPKQRAKTTCRNKGAGND